MLSNKLTPQDRRDIEKFTRFLAFKAAQVVVQSRLGQRIRTKCNPQSSVNDWFNLAIGDMPEVQAEAKRALSGNLSAGNNLCTEISLKTVEGDTLVLEMWNLGVREQCQGGVTNAIYNRMSLLLKSLISVTRVTPAYKLSSRQGPDSYVICYRIFMGQPQLQLLGSEYQQWRIGEVGTPLGTVTLQVMYRTQLTINREKSGTCPISSMMKSDYFHDDLSVGHGRMPLPSHDHRGVPVSTPNQPQQQRHSWSEEEDPLCVRELGKVVSTEPIRVQSPPSEKGVQQPPAASPSTKTQTVPKDAKHNQDNGLSELPYHKRVGAFAPVAKEPDASQFLLPETSFLSLLGTEDEIPGNLPETNIQEKTEETPTVTEGNGALLEAEVNASASSQGSTCDDFVLLDLKPPFAESVGVSGDLGAFFRECQSAPPLSSFSQQQQLDETVTYLALQLQDLETTATDFDRFVDSLCQSSP